MVDVLFEVLVDPMVRFLADEETLMRLGASKKQLNAQASGQSFDSQVARRIDEIARGVGSLMSVEAPVQPARRERLIEVYERDQATVAELKRLYDGACQLCGSTPFNGYLGPIAEGHHIHWLCNGGEDHLQNMILLCPNHHAAIHACTSSKAKERVRLI